MGVGSFAGFLNFNPTPVVRQIETKAIVDVQERVSRLLDQVDALPDPRVLRLTTDPPTSSPEVEQLIRAVDPQNLRATNPAVARRTLKMRIVYMRRQPEEIAAWEAALSAGSGANNTLDRTAGSHSLAAAGQRERSPHVRPKERCHWMEDRWNHI